MPKAISSQVKPQKGHRYTHTRTERFFAKATRKWCERYWLTCSCGQEFDVMWQRGAANRHMIMPPPPGEKATGILTTLL